MNILIILGVVFVAFSLVTVLCCLKVSGDISKIEEREEKY